MPKTYQQLAKECEELGVSINTLCMEARINRDVLTRWQRKEPKTLELYRAFRKAVKRLKAKKNAYDTPEEDILFTGS